MDYTAKKAELEKEAQELSKQGQQAQQALSQIAVRIEQIKGQLQLLAEIEKEK